MNRERFRRTAGPLSVETSGKSVDEAVQAALGRLRARRDEVEIEVLQEGRGGLFGIGSREARVRVRRVDRSEPRGDSRSDLRQNGRSDRRPSSGPSDSGGRRGGSGPRRSTEELDRLEREVEKGRTARGAAPRGGRPAAPPGPSLSSSSPSARAPRRREPSASVPDARPLTPRGDSAGPRQRAGSGGHLAAEARPEPRPALPPRATVTRSVPPPVESSPRVAPPSAVEPSVLADFTLGVLRRMGYDARVEASYADDAYEVRIDAGEHNEILIGKKGETLDALQHVLAKMASRGLDELLRVRVDVAEYRQKRSTELSERALEMAQQVVETGRETITEPLSAAERRSIHRALSDHPEVTTQSLGDGQVKPVRISLKGAHPAASGEVAPVIVRRGGSSRPVTPRTYTEERPRESAPEPRLSPAPESTPPAAPAPASNPATRSLGDPWEGLSGTKDKPAGGDAVTEWGRRPKPARGRRK
jgi:spoIIIJ-associated protein